MTREEQQKRDDIIEAIIGRQDGFAIQLRRLIGTPYFEVIYNAVRETTLADLEAKRTKLNEDIERLTEQS